MPEPASFRLSNDPPRTKRAKFDNQPAARQALLLVDMNDLPGQASLFQLNGQQETTNVEAQTATERTA